MSDLIERLKDQCTCQTYEGPGEPECVECDSVREIERLNAQALSLACEISKARRERDEARNTLAKIKTIVAGKTWTVALIYQIYTLLSGEKDDLNPSARQVIDEGER